MSEDTAKAGLGNWGTLEDNVRIQRGQRKIDDTAGATSASSSDYNGRRCASRVLGLRSLAAVAIALRDVEFGVRMGG